jgi:hypothetical protein
MNNVRYCLRVRAGGGPVCELVQGTNMPGAIIATSGAQERAHLYHDTLTVRAFAYCALIAQAGFLFGYDLDKSLAQTGMYLPPDYHDCH